MKKLIFILIFIIMYINSVDVIAATKCTAKADNGATCTANCATGQIASCAGGAKAVVCQCLDPQPPPPPPSYPIAAFAPGERDYFIYQLRPFIQSFVSQQGNDLVDALDRVIAAVDRMDEDEYNLAEQNYVEKRAALSESEKAALDQWVDENGFY